MSVANPQEKAILCDKFIRGTCGMCPHGKMHYETHAGTKYSCALPRECITGARGHHRCQCKPKA